MAFIQPVDIINRALVHLGKERVRTLTEQSINAIEGAAAYDNLRLAELRRSIWSFATRRVVLRPVGIDTLMWTPKDWVPGAYSVGAVVAYTPASGVYADQKSYWRLAVTEANSTVSPDADPNWVHYAGPQAIDIYDPEATYQAGEVVLTPSVGNGAVSYSINDVVSYNPASVWGSYVSLTNSNLANTPGSSPDDWVLWTGGGRSQGTYGLSSTGSPVPLNQVGAVSVWVSLYSGNTDHPLDNTGTWLEVDGTITPLVVSWPLGAGPVSQTSTRNVFCLPRGFLRRAPTDPKAGVNPYLGGPVNRWSEDWTFEGGYLVTGGAGPLLLRYVADVTDVTSFDPMFCEALSARIAEEIGPRVLFDMSISDRAQMIGNARSHYKTEMFEARMVDGIERGPTEPWEDDYIVVRY